MWKIRYSTIYMTTNYHKLRFTKKQRIQNNRHVTHVFYNLGNLRPSCDISISKCIIISKCFTRVLIAVIYSGMDVQNVWKRAVCIFKPPLHETNGLYPILKICMYTLALLYFRLFYIIIATISLFLSLLRFLASYKRQLQNDDLLFGFYEIDNTFPVFPFSFFFFTKD